MGLPSMLAIYFLFWVFSVFLVLPFGMKTSAEMGEPVQPGHAESAPHKFSLPKTLLRGTILATIVFALFGLNYIYGWVTPEMLDWTQW
ncbi:MAG: hypothetical protein CMN73_07665 [Sphingomonas sp.]|nr:hypothetical protein [Sphingomonas sp.]